MQQLDPQVEVIFQHETVSAVIDYAAGVLRIFSEPEPHPEDWRLAQQLAARVAGGGWDCYDDGGVDVFDIKIIASIKDIAA